MKILHINCSDSGSTGKIILDIAKESNRRGIDSVLCAPLRTLVNPQIKTHYTSFPYEQGLYRYLCKIGFFTYGFAPISTIKILYIIWAEKPDIVHLHSINGNMVNIYQLLKYLKKQNIPTVVTNHAEFFYTGSCAYAYECNQWIEGCKHCDRAYEATGCKFFDVSSKAWRKMYAAFAGFTALQVVSVSKWGYERSSISGILGKQSNIIIENGVNTEIFKPTNTLSVIEKYNIPSSKTCLLHVTSEFSDKMNDIKGGRYVIALANLLLHKDIIILVAATNVNVDTAMLPANIKLIGNVMNQYELAALYSLAQLTIVTSKKETYGMAVAESLCCGTPLVGFLAGGSESVAIKQYTRFVDYGDLVAYKDAIDELLQFKTLETGKQIAQEAAVKYSANLMARKYNDVYEQMRRN